MARIDLFDSYLHDELSAAERLKFDEQLKTDEAFAAEFKMYLLTVDGICREEHQDDMDFGMAMKRLSREELREIIGRRKPRITIDRYDIAEAILPMMRGDSAPGHEISGAAALNDTDDDDFEYPAAASKPNTTEREDDKKPSGEDDKKPSCKDDKKPSEVSNGGCSMRTFTIVFILALLLIALLSSIGGH